MRESVKKLIKNFQKGEFIKKTEIKAAWLILALNVFLSRSICFILSFRDSSKCHHKGFDRIGNDVVADGGEVLTVDVRFSCFGVAI